MSEQMKTDTRQQGFSLAELLVAMAIGLVIMGAIVKVYVSSGEANRRLEGVAAVQNNGRFIINFMQNTIMAADYRGCVAVGATLNNNLVSPTSYAYNFATSLSGSEWDAGTSAWVPALDAALTSPVNGNDSITVRGVVDFPVPVTGTMSTISDNLTVASNNHYSAGTILLVSDCAGNANVFQKTNAFTTGTATTVAHATGSGTPGNSTASFSTAYSTDAMIAPVATTGLYIRANSRGINSLYAVQPSIAGSTTPVELVEGVDGMQILYGVAPTGASNNTATQYLTASQVNGASLWNNVMTVRVAVLVSSPNPSSKVPDTRTYSLLTTNYGPYNDYRIRQVFTTTVTLRNRYMRR